MKNCPPSVDTKTFFQLPKSVPVDGKLYPIRWHFTAAFQFMEYVDTSEDEDEIFLQKVLEIWYPQIPDNKNEALTQAIRFYCGGNFPKEGYYTPLFSPQGKKENIYHYFLNQYGIDLNHDTVHWWVFRKLLEQAQKGGSHGI